MKFCPACQSDRPDASFSIVKRICNLCHLDGREIPEPPTAPVTQPVQDTTSVQIVTTDKRGDSLAAELAARTLARRRLLHFVTRFKPDYQAGWMHNNICARLERFVKDVEDRKSPRLLICCPPRSGKALTLDTPVPTPSGWSTMGDLKPGDEVFSDTGEVCRVVAKSPVWKDRDVYRVSTDMGDEIIADGEHEWVVRLCRKYGAYKRYDTKTLAARTSPRKPLLHPSGPIELPEVTLPIDPYVLGMWLGNGRSDGPAICHPDLEVVEEVSRIEGGRRDYAHHNGCYHFRPGPSYKEGAAKEETLSGRLRAMGQYEQKHIPVTYLRSSHAQRLHLLQGLIYSDGYVGPNGAIEFCSMSLVLAEGVRELVTTLGVKASLLRGRAKFNGKDYGEKYRVCFYMQDAARPGRNGTYLSFDPCGRADTVCIEVDSPSHQFLVGRTMIPTHNSEVTSRNFPAWVLGHHPDWEIIAASHTLSLSLKFSRSLRDKLRDPSYQAVFPDTVLDPQSQSVETWQTTAGGAYLSAGTGSGITGQGCNILIIDDPVRDMEAADSALQREALWDWYISTAYTRVAPGGGVLGIMTLWNEDDWGGRVISYSENGEGDKFEVVRYQAINEGYAEYENNETFQIVRKYPDDPVPENCTLVRLPDSALHPERYNIDMLQAIKRNMLASGQARVWSALYQQNPAPDEGAYFTKNMFRYYLTPPRRSKVKVYQAWDFAISTGNESDYTVGVTVAHDEVDNLHVLDVKRFRSDDSIHIVDVILDYAQEFDADLLGFEDGQIWKALSAQFTKRCDERRIYPSWELMKPFTDKIVRANPLRGRMQVGKVYFDKQAPWYPDLEREMLFFPAGKHDDQVDGLAWAVRLSLQNTAPVAKTPKALVSWKEKALRGYKVGGGHMSA